MGVVIASNHTVHCNRREQNDVTNARHCMVGPQIVDMHGNAPIDVKSHPHPIHLLHGDLTSTSCPTPGTFAV